MMASDVSTNEIVHEIPGLIRVYKDGTVERLKGNEVVPASTDPQIGVQSKDVVISPETGLSARLFIPKAADPSHKLPLLIYFHGGAFCVESASSPTFHNYLNSVVAAANVVTICVDYRRAPEHPLPIAYDDCWAAISWATAADCRDSWLKDFADFDRVYFAGDSAGGNIAHHMAMRVGSEGLSGAKLVGIVLVHPWFWGKEPIGSEAANVGLKSQVQNRWVLVCPSTSGLDDPLLNPILDPNFPGLGCERVLVCVAGKDGLGDRGRYYHDELKKSEWKGKVEIMESAGEDHVFHLFNPTCENAVALLKLFASFLNEDQA